MTTARLHNFNAGPAVLPVPVLEEARDNMLSLGKSGIGIMEHTHRGKDFEALIQTAEKDCRELLAIPDQYQVLFLQGGATLQFSMVPMNLLGSGQVADYIVTGGWSEKAVKEAKKVGEVHIAGSSKESNFDRIPKMDQIKYSANPAYVHFTSNNTLYGTEWSTEPTGADGLLVCDASSDIMGRALPVKKYGLIYAGAQKNLGPSGVVLVIMREDWLARSKDTLPTYCNYAIHAKEKSLYNTPNTWGIYIMYLVFRWMKQQGGMAVIEKHNRDKAGLIYNAIDSSKGFYRGHAQPDSRSLMNITFRLPSEELENKFAEEAKKAGMVGLKGHRSVGGMRASTYNALPRQACDVLAAFMKDFASRNG
ncbi:MAG: Phosphoserine aminotransferase [Phycisphaerae bacterium]|nr:Phosphoserine aminotransferase [Phycisphaerae bacterium]